MNLPHLLLAFVLCATLAPAAAAAAAAQYPSRPVRIVVPFAAGGPSDAAARAVGQAMAKSLGQPVVIENKPGADGGIAAQFVAAAPADGYTLLWATSSILALPLVTKPAAFDTFADFAPVASVGRFAFGMYVHPGVPSQTLADFIVHARANPGKLNYATVNMGEHLAASQFMKAASVDMVRVPYKGAAQLMPDLVAGRVQVYFGPVGSGIAHAREGRLRLLATLLPQRTAMTPEVPTMAEAGLPGVSVLTYQIVLAPAKTPREVLERLTREVSAALQDAEVRAMLAKLALTIEGSTPQDLAATIREADRAWARFIGESGLAPP